MSRLPQNKKNFVMSCLSRSLNCSSSISRYVLAYIYGAWINQKNSFDWDIILENIAFLQKMSSRSTPNVSYHTITRLTILNPHTMPEQ